MRPDSFARDWFGNLSVRQFHELPETNFMTRLLLRLIKPVQFIVLFSATSAFG
jgi:hypothetical protein